MEKDKITGTGKGKVHPGTGHEDPEVEFLQPWG
jgi:hypothetical protein